MSFVDRFIWLAKRRTELHKSGSGAHWLAFVDSSSILAGNNRLGKGTHIHDSKIGRHTYVVNARIVRSDIGSFCSIGPEVNIGGLGRHPAKWISTHPMFYSTIKQSGKTFAKDDLFEELKVNKIGSDVWIGARSLILDGIQIGNGAIVAAGSVVTQDVPPYAIAGGVPARVIKHRFSADVISSLLEWQWWLLPDEVLAHLAILFCETDNWTVEIINELKTLAATIRVESERSRDVKN